jgi:L-alanine-DL-glutamate epimerase-like enolase superfamily enzyme
VKITKVETHIVRIPMLDRFGGQNAGPAKLKGDLYHFEKEWNEVHPTVSQCVLVRIETDNGLHGWGECQAPIAPEVAREVIDQLLGPMILGADPHAVNFIWNRIYRSMAGRGQITGFMLDAMAGIDIALWDIKGKDAGVPVSQLLGGPCRERLPLYISGLRGTTAEARAKMANEFYAQGFAAVKVYIGRGVEADLKYMRSLREAIGADKRLLVDTQWRYSLADAERIGRGLEELNVEWFETPVLPENVKGQARLAAALQIPVTAGESMRTRFEFREWFEQGALDIAQPDIARCGITEGKRIADMAEAYHVPIALHLGLSLGVANAATWHVAAAIPNFYIQEIHPPLVEVSNRFFREPLEIVKGEAIVPNRPGLGIEIDREALAKVAQVL